MLAGNLEPGKLIPMQSTDFHQQILGISSPWKIVNVDLDIDAKRVVIRTEVDRKTKWYHPDTKLQASLHKWTERAWRHLDTCQFETLIIAEVPSVKHKDGSIEEIEEIAVPWAGRYQRHTKLLAFLINECSLLNAPLSNKRSRPFAGRLLGNESVP